MTLTTYAILLGGALFVASRDFSARRYAVQTQRYSYPSVPP